MDSLLDPDTGYNLFQKIRGSLCYKVSYDQISQKDKRFSQNHWIKIRCFNGREYKSQYNRISIKIM